MNPIILILDGCVLAIATMMLISSVKSHGMPATVHFVRLVTVVMGLFSLVQFKWEDFFEVLAGRSAFMMDFIDVKNSILLTMMFYILSMVTLFVYEVYQRRVNSAKLVGHTPQAAEEQSPPSCVGQA